MGKAIFSEIAAEEVNWIAGKKKSDWGGGFALWTRDKEEAKLSEKARKKAKWAYYRALESDWESNGLFEKSGAGETGRLTRELLRYQMIHGFGNSQFGLSPKERDLWQAGEHDLIQPLRLGFIEQIAHSIIIAVGTMGIGTALSAVDAISKFGATALTTLAGTGMQVGASFVSSGSNLWGGADPYLEGQKLASALSKSVIAGGLGVLSAGAGEILGEGLVGKVLVDGGLAAGRSMIGGALSSAVLGEALDGKGLLLNAAFAGLGGGIASGLGQMEGLGSLGEDMLNSGVHFGLDTGKAALMALDGDGNFDDTQFLADWGGSFAGNGFSALGSLASYGVRGGLNDYSNQRASDAAEKMKESYTATQSLSKTGLSDDLMDRLGGVGGIFDSFGLLTESMVRGAALGRAQTMDGTGFGVGLGQSIGGFVAMGQSVDSIDSTASLYENGRIIKGYQAGPNVVDGSYQAMLNAYSNAKYNRRMSRADRFAMLRELRERKIEFTNNKAKLAYDPETGQLGTARTEGTISYLNADELLSSDIGKQLHIATVLSHESARDGRASLNQQAETRESVQAHWRYQDVLARGRHARAYVGALDGDKALDFKVGRLYQQGIIGEEDIQKYIDGNYDSNGDFWRLAKDGKLEWDGDWNINDETGKKLIDFRDLDKLSSEDLQRLNQYLNQGVDRTQIVQNLGEANIINKRQLHFELQSRGDYIVPDLQNVLWSGMGEQKIVRYLGGTSSLEYSMDNLMSHTRFKAINDLYNDGHVTNAEARSTERMFLQGQIPMSPTLNWSTREPLNRNYEYLNADQKALRNKFFSNDNIIRENWQSLFPNQGAMQRFLGTGTPSEKARMLKRLADSGIDVRTSFNNLEYRLLPSGESIAHGPAGDGTDNWKWVSGNPGETGREIVINPEGSFDYSQYRGTYNFTNQRGGKRTFFTHQSTREHFFYDYVPWKIWGISP